MASNPYNHTLTWSQQEIVNDIDMNQWKKDNPLRSDESFNEAYWMHRGDWEMPRNTLEHKESHMMYIVAYLMEKGHNPLQSETLEEFVVRCR
jgi:hypothetical protein